MKILTPMKRFRSNLDLLITLLGNDYRTFNLNRSRGAQSFFDFHHRYYGSPINEDHIVVFTPCMENRKENCSSFAFNFDFLGKQADSQSIKASIKPLIHMENSCLPVTSEERSNLNKWIVYSNPMSLDSFKSKLNEFIKALQTGKRLSKNETINLFNAVFIEEDNDTIVRLGQAKSKLEAISKQNTDEVNALKVTLQGLNHKKSASIDDSLNKLEDNPLVVKRNSLLAEIASLDAQIAIAKINQDKDSGVNTVEQEILKIKDLITATKRKNDEKANEVVTSQGKLVQAILTNK